MASTTAPQGVTIRGLLEETDRFAGVRSLGFEPMKDKIARDLLEKEKVAAAAEPPTEAGRAAMEKGGDYKPLKEGEIVWDEGVSGRRRDNIIGGWA